MPCPLSWAGGIGKASEDAVRSAMMRKGQNMPPYRFVTCRKRSKVATREGEQEQVERRCWCASERCQERLKW